MCALKSRFCCRGDRQTEGVDFFDTFAPVVNWNAMRQAIVWVHEHVTGSFRWIAITWTRIRPHLSSIIKCDAIAIPLWWKLTHGYDYACRLSLPARTTTTNVQCLSVDNRVFMCMKWAKGQPWLSCRLVHDLKHLICLHACDIESDHWVCPSQEDLQTF